MALMNKPQYEIVKTMSGFPLFNARKFAKMIKVDLIEVQRVQVAGSYEQYAEDDRPEEDILAQFWQLFGGAK